MTPHSFDEVINGYGPEETFKTYETYSISNHDFLQTIFAEASGTPFVVHFAGDPRAVGHGAWAGKPYRRGGAKFCEAQNSKRFWVNSDLGALRRLSLPRQKRARRSRYR